MQRRAPMRLALALSLAAAAAHADTGPSMMCSTSSFQVTVSFGLSTKQSDGTFQDIAPASINSALNQAECLCEQGDLFVTGRVTNTTLSSQTAIPLEVWIGSSCNVSTNRNTGSALCQKLNATVDYRNFAMGGTTPEQQILVRLLADPSTPGGSCPTANISGNALWFLFNPNNAMAEYCQITLPVNNLPPSPPINVTAGSGDGAVTLAWNPPPVNSPQPNGGYQILCADEAGQPVQALHDMFISKLIYSACTMAHGLERRPLPTSGAVGNTDGGVATDDAGAGGGGGGGAGGSGLGGDADPVDGGTQPAFTADTGAPFTNLDTRFICSDKIDVTTTSTRIDGLENGKKYFFVVVGVDSNGNPSASQVVTATPQPVEDLYRRFRDQGGAPQGFCAMAPSPRAWSLLALVAAAAAALALRRWRRRR